MSSASVSKATASKPAARVPFYTPVQDPPCGTALHLDPEATPTLFRPLTIRGVTLVNRFVVSPMVGPIHCARGFDNHHLPNSSSSANTRPTMATSPTGTSSTWGLSACAALPSPSSRPPVSSPTVESPPKTLASGRTPRWLPSSASQTLFIPRATRPVSSSPTRGGKLAPWRPGTDNKMTASLPTKTLVGGLTMYGGPVPSHLIRKRFRRSRKCRSTKSTRQ